MNNAASGREAERKSLEARSDAKAQSGTGCSFCWFVLTVYPTLTGMTERDTTTFREHLKQAHGLRSEIKE